MVGITSYSAYIPWYRISKAKMSETTSFLMTYPTPGERSVANANEDSVTMATSAAQYCLDGEDRNKIDGFYFATTSPGYVIRQHASIASNALDISESARVADFQSGGKAGMVALLNAIDAVKAGSLKNVMVSAADCRLVKPGNAQEFVYGDGAAAFIVGSDNVVAELVASYSVSVDFQDRWRAIYEPFEHSWEDRWIRDEGFEKLVPMAADGVLKKANMTMKDMFRVAFVYPNAGGHKGLAKKMGIDAAQVQDNLMDKVGDTGVAYPLMMFIGALEESKAGDKILVVGYGQGAEAMIFKVTDKIGTMKDKWGVKKNLARRKELDSWAKFASARGSVRFDIGAREGEYALSALSMLYRERKQIAKCYGNKCKKCGNVQYPPRRVCVNPSCRAIDEYEDFRLSDKKGKVFSYCVDYNICYPLPPVLSGYANMDAGARINCQFVDMDPTEIKIGTPIEMCFRRKFTDYPRGITNYFWCATNARQ